MILSKTNHFLRLLAAGFRRAPAEAMLAERLESLQQKRWPPTPEAPMMTVGAAMDAAYYAMLGEIVSGLCARQALRTEQIFTQSLRPGASQSLRHFLRAKLDNNAFSYRKWERLYGIFCESVGYRTVSWIAPFRALRQWRQAWKMWRSLRDTNQLAALVHDEIVIGDLVIDTYLRLRPTVSIRLDDPYLLVVIRQALKDVELAFAYFRRARPAVFLTIYTTYLSFGVPVRVALACGVKTISFGNLQEFCTSVTPEHRNHTKDSSRYCANFDAMPDKVAKAARAAEALEARLSGQIDAATAYMKKSAYAVTTQAVPEVRGATILFLHDFYDSLHIYSWVLFHDFWEWVGFTIETLQAAGKSVWIKPHPNQGAESSAEIAALRHKYPGAHFLPTEITNRQLVDAGMACAVTVYGSVAPEVAFMGVPSISSGDSPHASFDAFHLARTREDYAALLATPPLPGADTERLKAHACGFYYMHNLNLDADGALLRERFIAVWTHLFNPDANGCFDRAKTYTVLSALTDSQAFQRFSENLLSVNPS